MPDFCNFSRSNSFFSQWFLFKYWCHLISLILSSTQPRSNFVTPPPPPTYLYSILDLSPVFIARKRERERDRERERERERDRYLQNFSLLSPWFFARVLLTTTIVCLSVCLCLCPLHSFSSVCLCVFCRSFQSRFYVDLPWIMTVAFPFVYFLSVCLSVSTI